MMQKWLDWYHSNEPDAVARREKDKLEEQNREKIERDQENDYQEWLSVNKEKQQQTLEKLIAEAQRKLDFVMREIYKNEQVREAVKKLLQNL